MTRTLLLVLAALVLGGCLGPAPKENYYNLSATDGAAAPAASAAGPSVHVASVAVPDSVDRTAMVMRVAPNRVEIDDANRWVEPLKSAIPRVLAEDLRRELGTDRVSSGRSGPGAPDFVVTVDVQRFESSLTEGATLDAAWRITPPGGTARTGRTVANEASSTKDAAGLAAAHSRNVAQLARDIAGAIRR